MADAVPAYSVENVPLTYGNHLKVEEMGTHTIFEAHKIKFVRLLAKKNKTGTDNAS